MNAEPKLCTYCKSEIVGRSDKVFCSTYCKSAYHNARTNSDERFIRNINKQLRKNRSALRTACPLGKATVRKSFLKKLGMNFKFITHTWKSQAGVVYFFCYDYGYTQANEESKVLIIQQQHYMNDQEIIKNTT